MIEVSGAASLAGRVGQEVAVSDWLEVTQERIDRFAETTDDRQWIAAFGDGIGYVTMRNLAVAAGSGNFHLFKTSDGGQHWDGGRAIGNVSQSWT